MFDFIVASISEIDDDTQRKDVNCFDQAHESPTQQDKKLISYVKLKL